MAIVETKTSTIMTTDSLLDIQLPSGDACAFTEEVLDLLHVLAEGWDESIQLSRL